MKKIAFVFAVILASCGDENSNSNPIEPVVEISTSSSMKESSLSVKPGESSSSLLPENKSSSSKTKSSSSEGSSSSVKPGESSSSLLPENKSSSSKTKSSSSEGSSSSVKPGESSSSLLSENKSSSSETKSSSSEGSSSSEEQGNSSSLELTGICKTKTEDNCVYGTLYDDRDGKTYKTVKIGEQEWMAENLNFKVDVIENTSYRSFCEKDSALCSRYGRHYTWAAAIDSISLYELYSIRCGVGRTCAMPDKIKGVCPSGWHLPNQKEWEQLINFIGASNAGEILKSFTDWTKWPGTDLYGFCALPSGLVHNASISSRGAKTSLWTATDHNNFSAQCAEFNYSESRKDVVMLQADTKSNVAGMPVRCVKD